MKSPLADINRRTYAKAPSWQQIQEAINETGMLMYQFERFYGIPFNVLVQVKSGARQLPANFWHYIYEKIKPTYGVGYLKDYNEEWIKKAESLNLTKRLTKRKLKIKKVNTPEVSKLFTN